MVYDEKMMERVFEAVKEERKYQTDLWGPTPTGGEHSVGEFLMFMEDYLNEAKHSMSRKVNAVAVPEALHIIRKIAALCFTAMEQNGIERRDMGDLNKSCELHAVRCRKDDEE